MGASAKMGMVPNMMACLFHESLGTLGRILHSSSMMTNVKNANVTWVWLEGIPYLSAVACTPDPIFPHEFAELPLGLDCLMAALSPCTMMMFRTTTPRRMSTAWSQVKMAMKKQTTTSNRGRSLQKSDHEIFSIPAINVFVYPLLPWHSPHPSADLVRIFSPPNCPSAARVRFPKEAFNLSFNPTLFFHHDHVLFLVLEWGWVGG